MDFDISEKIKKWESEIGQEFDRFIKNELSKYGIDEEHGLERVEVKNVCENDLALTYPECFPGVTRLSDWYIDGALAFSIFRKVEMENEGLDAKKTGENKFEISPNGKASVFSCKMTETYFIRRSNVNGVQM